MAVLRILQLGFNQWRPSPYLTISIVHGNCSAKRIGGAVGIYKMWGLSQLCFGALFNLAHRGLCRGLRTLSRHQVRSELSIAPAETG